MDDFRNSNKHLIGGLIFLFVGLVLLLDQVGILNASRVFMFWPLILVYFGYRKFTHTSNMSGRFWGGFLLLLGVSLQAEELGYGHVRFDTIWPVLLICAGILLILKRYEAREWDNIPPNNPPPGPTIDVPPAGPPPGAVGSAVSSAVGSAVDSAVRSAVDSAIGVPPPPSGMPPGAPPGPASEPAPGAAATPPSSPAGAPSSSFGFCAPPQTHSNFAGDPTGQRWPRSEKPWDDFQKNMRDFGKRMDEFGERVHREWGNPGNQNPGNRNPGNFNSGNYSQSGSPRLNEVNIFWGGKRRIVTRNFMGGDVVAIFGGYEIDLTESDMQGEQVSIEVVSIFGGGEIRVPGNWEVVMDTVGIFGGCGDRTRHPDPPPPGVTNPDGSAIPRPKRLIIRGVAIFGGMTVRN